MPGRIVKEMPKEVLPQALPPGAVTCSSHSFSAQSRVATNMQKRRFHSQNAGFKMSAPIDIGVKISAGGGCQSQPPQARVSGLIVNFRQMQNDECT
jgi:hypothetical protein